MPPIEWNADDIARLEDLLRFRDEIACIPKILDRLGATETAYSALTRRVDNIAMAEENARKIAELQQKHLDEKFNDLNRKIGELQTVVSRVGWAIVLAVLGALMTFALSGGFKVV